MAPRRTAVLVSVALLFAGIETSIGNAQETPATVKAVQLIGLTGVKQNAKGDLKVGNENLQFLHGKTSADINATSIQDVVTGDDTQRSVGGTVGAMSMAAPYVTAVAQSTSTRYGVGPSSRYDPVDWDCT